VSNLQKEHFRICSRQTAIWFNNQSLSRICAKDVEYVSGGPQTLPASKGAKHSLVLSSMFMDIPLGALIRRSMWTEARNPSLRMEMAIYANTSISMHTDLFEGKESIHPVEPFCKGHGEHLKQHPKELAECPFLRETIGSIVISTSASLISERGEQ